MKSERILVIQTAFPGDAILTLPMIEMIKNSLPHSTIDVLCIPATSEIFAHSPFVNEVIVYDKKKGGNKILSILKISKRIRANSYSRIYSPHRSARTALIVLFSRVKETYSFDNSSLSFVYKHLVKYDGTKHEVARNLELAGFITENENWKIFPRIDCPKKAEELLKEKGLDCPAKFVVVAPGSVWATKKYPEEYYLQIVKYFAGSGYRVFLIGSHDEVELCAEIERKAGGNVISIAGKFSITESISILQKARLLICNDSAPTHMAMVAGVPVITIYCSTLPQFGFYPYSGQSFYLSFDKLECKPCGIHGRNSCPIKTFDCAYKLRPETIINRANILLDAGKK